LFLLSGQVIFLNAQDIEIDSTYFESYKQVINYFPEIHTGGQYVELRRSLEGHPFYGDNQMETGTVYISGFRFTNVPVQYDIWDDILLTFTPVYKQKVILNHLKVTRFDLHDGTVFKKKSNTSYTFHKNGFYREIVVGKIALYCKHRKEKKQESSTVELLRSYNQVEKYFFEIDGLLQEVPNRRKIFPLLGLNKRNAKKILRSKGYLFRRNQEDYLSTLVKMANEKETNE
jgi:hypothetical protein